MTTAYPETNAEVIEKVLYCLRHGETESVENWLDLLRERLSTVEQHEAAPADSDFKNFHRLLCDRFSYAHDEIDWKRDQLSLIEHIAAAWQPAKVPVLIAIDLERTNWTPETALRWYADGKHFDVVNGRTRILDTGAIASNALKKLDAEYHAMKGADASFPFPAPSAPLEGTGNGADERAALEELRSQMAYIAAYSNDDLETMKKYQLLNWGGAVISRARRACEYARTPRTEAEIRRSMTSEQIQLERKLTCEAIDGAMAFGYQNTNPPPSADHWLAPYWHVGRKQAEQEAALSRAPRTEVAEAVPDLTKADFTRACRLLPPDFAWGSPVTPRMVLDIALVAAPQPPSADAAAAGQEAVAWIQHRDGVVYLDTLGQCERLEDFPHGTKFYTSPPAQVATRQELTVRQRMDLLLVADDMEVSGDAKLANALRALLEGAKHE